MQQGKALFGRDRFDEALLAYQIGYTLDPELPGFLRELGATYDKLGLADKKTEYYQAYLRARPLGDSADEIRRVLLKIPGALGTLVIDSSLPCDELWLNRQRVLARLPVTDLSVAPGEYRLLCVNYGHEIAYFEYVEVEPGQAARLRFEWAIVVNALEKPFGRITIENPRIPGVMMDLGISRPAVGVIVPRDGRALRMILSADTGTRKEERFISLQPGQRYVIKW